MFTQTDLNAELNAALVVAQEKYAMSQFLLSVKERAEAEYQYEKFLHLYDQLVD